MSYPVSLIGLHGYIHAENERKSAAEPFALGDGARDSCPIVAL